MCESANITLQFAPFIFTPTHVCIMMGLIYWKSRACFHFSKWIFIYLREWDQSEALLWLHNWTEQLHLMYKANGIFSLQSEFSSFKVNVHLAWWMRWSYGEFNHHMWLKILFFKVSLHMIGCSVFHLIYIWNVTLTFSIILSNLHHPLS